MGVIISILEPQGISISERVRCIRIGSSSFQALAFGFELCVTN